MEESRGRAPLPTLQKQQAHRRVAPELGPLRYGRIICEGRLCYEPKISRTYCRQGASDQSVALIELQVLDKEGDILMKPQLPTSLTIIIRLLNLRSVLS